MNKPTNPWTIRFAGSDDELERCYRVMVELRPHLSLDQFREAVRRQDEQDGYRLVYLEEEGEVRAAAGFRIQHKLICGRELYVDDLVTLEERRSRGHGAALFHWLVEHARDQGCDHFSLDSGVQRAAAHRFYFRQRMRISSYHFTLKLHHGEPEEG